MVAAFSEPKLIVIRTHQITMFIIEHKRDMANQVGSVTLQSGQLTVVNSLQLTLCHRGMMLATPTSVEHARTAVSC
jgi:Zn finger protein HypA/HybF involved in hydrogenase expression